jgi:enterochelin esterase-like enzyme
MSLRRITLTLCLGVITMINSVPESAHAQWGVPPSEEILENTSGLIHATFESEAMDTTVGYCVVLPPGYENGDRRYPVVYWLHGGGGNESSSLSTAPLWRELSVAGEIEPVILVYPNGFRSGYMDHADGKVMIETMIIRELIPRIDATYRTVASREGRAVHGFSMGSSGGLRFGIKYPELFCSVVAYGGGAINLETSTDPFILKIIERNLANDPELIRQHNTFYFLEKNQEIVRQKGIRFLLICGDVDNWKESAVSFQRVLEEKGIPCGLIIVPEIGHQIGRLYRTTGKEAALFQNQVFESALSPEGD